MLIAGVNVLNNVVKMNKINIKEFNDKFNEFFKRRIDICNNISCGSNHNELNKLNQIELNLRIKFSNYLESL